MVRYHTFVVRKQTGGDADDAHVCPLCTFDWRASTYAGMGGSTSGKAVGLNMLKSAFSNKDLITQMSGNQQMTVTNKPRKGRSRIEVGSSSSSSTGSMGTLDDSMSLSSAAVAFPRIRTPVRK